ncbi:MAG: Rieske 2Fe-2S domain-containing protein [Thermodesulfobacteriota bacterium]
MAEQQDKKDRAPDESRRGFLNKLWAALGLVVLAELVWLVVSFLRPRKQGSEPDGYGTVILAGSVEGFARNTVTAFPRGQFYLACLEDGGFLAISRKCTHLGCTVPWVEEDNRFACPCHGSAFDITGSVVQAPAPRALDLFPVTIENNVVRVNTGKRIKRSEFQASQVAYPKGT